ncbi:MAG: SDR family NAD(P)-dependent oxidoreductase [Christensenellaceae bacterium]|jgi:NAD(P)-dependent dehydrogenase (short-subunit alcohol dehydrogenase family)
MSNEGVYTHLPYVEFKELLDLKGKTAVVTGGGDGIGLAISKRLAEAGANVVMGSLGEEKTQEVIGAGYPSKFVQTDVTDLNAIKNLLSEANKTFGSVDIYVNNAGIYPLKAIHDITPEFWDRMFAINTKAMFFGAQLSSQYMIDQGKGGAIVNMSSICAHRPMHNHVTYDASKGAVVSMTRTLAKDLGPHNIRVNSVSPGLIATPGNLEPELLKEHEDMNTLNNIPIKRRGEPYEIGNAVLFLVSPMASYVSGIDMLVDAGWATNL